MEEIIMSSEHSDRKNMPGENSRPLSKVCDAADLFSPEYLDVIKSELQAVPAMHRKQWEFGMIYLALKKTAMLKEDKVGLSMGSGNEVVLYAIARRVRHLTVTDLYSGETLWDCARAANPEEYIQKCKPFPVDDSKLSALNMDMRHLSFADNSFDFAYSACAFEHIGVDADFLQHLHEVYRVLKNGGVYVMTTEFTFEQNTTTIPHNYLFSAEHLGRLIAESGFSPETHFDARITEQSANFPIPAQVDDLLYRGERHFAQMFVAYNVIPHVQVLYGKNAFTSCIIVLRKDTTGSQIRKPVVFEGLAESRAFLATCLKQYHAMLQMDLNLCPFAYLRGRKSRYFAPHVLQADPATLDQSNTIFHTNYYWLGNDLRTVYISMSPASTEHGAAFFVEFRVHRFKTNDPAVVDCCYHTAAWLSSSQEIRHDITLAFDDDYSYAVLAVLYEGAAEFSEISVRISMPDQNGVRTIISG